MNSDNLNCLLVITGLLLFAFGIGGGGCYVSHLDKQGRMASYKWCIENSAEAIERVTCRTLLGRHQ